MLEFTLGLKTPIPRSDFESCLLVVHPAEASRQMTARELHDSRSIALNRSEVPRVESSDVELVVDSMEIPLFGIRLSSCRACPLLE